MTMWLLRECSPDEHAGSDFKPGKLDGQEDVLGNHGNHGNQPCHQSSELADALPITHGG